MSETLASRRSPVRSRGAERASRCLASAPCPFLGPEATGGGLRDPKEGGLGRRSRLRVISWNAPAHGSNGGGSPATTRPRSHCKRGPKPQERAGSAILKAKDC